MLASSIPARFTIPFANAAGPSFIRAIPTLSSATPGAASLTDGFPPLNFQPVASGGVPPFGQDFNGLMKQVTLWSQWQAAGNPVFYDAAFSTAIGGYPRGAVLASTTAGLQWLNLVDNNATDPDGGGPANWLAFGPGAIQLQQGNYAVATGTNTYAIALAPVPASYTALIGVPIRVKFTNGMSSLSCTLNVNGLGAKPLFRTPSNTTLFYSDIQASDIIELIYDGTGFQIPALSNAASQGAGTARTTVIPNTNTATTIFAAIQATIMVAFDFGSGNAFCDQIMWYQGGAITVVGAGNVGSPGTRTYSLAASVLQMALTGAPGAANVTPVVVQSVGPSP